MVYVALGLVNWESSSSVRRSCALRVTGGKTTLVMVAALGFVLALVGRDLVVPLLVISMFGLFDRLVGAPLIRSRAEN